MQKEKESVLKQIPKTASGFETNFKALKKSPSDQYQLLKNIPLSNIESYYKSTEIQTEVFNGILNVLKSEGSDDLKWKGDLMLTLSKADSFDMTLMMVEDKESDIIKSIISDLKLKDSLLAAKLEKAYS